MAVKSRLTRVSRHQKLAIIIHIRSSARVTVIIATFRSNSSIITQHLRSVTLLDFMCNTLRAGEAAAQCIVIGPVCGFVCVCGSYHNSKFRASILTELGL